MGAAGLVLVYSLRGGSYDILVFEEHGLVIWWLLAVGLALGLLPRTRPSRYAMLLLSALAAYALWTGLSLMWTQSSELTTEELARSLDYFGLVALIICALDRATWRPAAAGLAFGAMLVCTLAVGSHLAPTVFGVDRLDTTFHLDRLSVPFGYWNAVAAFGAMCVAIGLAWSAHESSRVLRSVALGFVPVAVTAVYLTYSRAGVFGVGLAVLATVVLSRNRFTALIHVAGAAGGSAVVIVAVRTSPQVAHATGTAGSSSVFGALVFAAAVGGGLAILTSIGRVDRWSVPRRLIRPLGGVALVLLLIAAAAVGPRLLSRGWHSFTRPETAQTSSDPTARLSSLSSTRYPLWKAAMNSFDAHPAGGTGAGTIEFWWNQHATNIGFVRDAHNIWLENMSELGVPGLLLIVGVAVSAMVSGMAIRLRARRRATAGIGTAFVAAFLVYLLHASVDWMWESTAVTVLALAGVAVLTPRLGTTLPRLKLRVRTVLAVAAVIAGAVQIPGMLSTAEIRRSQSAARAGDQAAALAWARDAVRAEPWSATAYEQRAMVLEATGKLRSAAGDLGRAISHEPFNYRHWLIRARVETELGQLAAAAGDYARARHLRPRGAVFALSPDVARR